MVDNIKIIFKKPIKKLVKNYLTNELCFMCSSEKRFGSEFKNDSESVIRICNQQLVYDYLFRKRLNGRRYSSDDAKWFLNWITDGWEKQTFFVFLIRNRKGRIIATIDIKSNNLNSGEIGYWADEENPGIMTNSVIKLCEIAKQAGYKELYALTLSENKNSINVVQRAGFTKKEEIDKNHKHYFKYSKQL